jgi:uncharacterized DUF497 family protein
VFRWDPKKAASNIRKHGVSFEEAAIVFLDPLAVIDNDQVMSPRESILGRSFHGREIYVVFVEHDRDVIRIISARRATSAERKRYEEGT